MSKLDEYRYLGIEETTNLCFVLSEVLRSDKGREVPYTIQMSNLNKSNTVLQLCTCVNP